MSDALFEAVPNFSEGRDEAKVHAIADAARGVPGVQLLDVERNADHHRAVVSLAGPGEALSEALFRMIRKATEIIDLNHHTGEHPRMGATDVVPFVPLAGATMADAVGLAERLGERVWRELGVPVYLYAEAARRPERRDLAKVRAGGFEGIRDAIATDPARAPDFGTARVHPTAGIVAIGARPVLIAFNAYLATPDVAVAKAIAHAVRERDGGLPSVKALGFEIRERGQAQVSMNLVDYRTTPIHRALAAVRAEAERRGTRVTDTEIVGLVPEDALFDAAEAGLDLRGFDRAAILERKVRAASRPDRLSGLDLATFAGRLAERTPTPGGGSAAGAAGVLGTALGEMVIAYSRPRDGADPELAALAEALAADRAAFLDGIDADARAYEAVRDARRALKAAPDAPAARDALAGAMERAIDVPLETARRARAVAERLRAVAPRLKATLGSDLATAFALLEAARAGGVANARINLPDLEALGRPTATRAAAIASVAAPIGE